MTWTHLTLYRYNRFIWSAEEEEVLIPFSFQRPKTKTRKGWFQKYLTNIERSLKCLVRKKKKQLLRN